MTDIERKNFEKIEKKCAMYFHLKNHENAI